MTVCSARTSILAGTYKQAIEICGAQMDEIWGNGKWKLLRCEASPAVRDHRGDVLVWEWEFEIGWLGP